jgi:hypothetical protein
MIMNLLTKRNLDLSAGFSTESDTFSREEVSEVLSFLADNGVRAEERFFIAKNVRHSDGKSKDWYKDYYFTKKQMIKEVFPHFPTWATYAIGGAEISNRGRRVAVITKHLTNL